MTGDGLFTAPLPRDALGDPGLVRPDHYGAKPRPVALLALDRGECVDPELTALAHRLLRELPSELVWCYPTSGPLYRKLAAHLGIEPDRLLLTRGSDGAIKTVFEAYVAPGDTVVLPDPTYQMYDVYLRLFGARPALVPYALTGQGPHLEADDLIAAIGLERPKLVCLPNPDNPTGFVFEAPALRAIVEAAGEAGALILVDEAYYPFHPVTAMPWIDEFDHLVIARTFSKAWGLAGMRIGYAAACPAVAEVLHKTRPMIEADGIAMALVERMLDHRDAVEASLARLKDGRAFFASEMKKLGFRAVETAGNFVLVDFGDRRAAVEAALAPVARYRLFSETCLKDFLRFTTTTRELFAPVIAAIRGVAT